MTAVSSRRRTIGLRNTPREYYCQSHRLHLSDDRTSRTPDVGGLSEAACRLNHSKCNNRRDELPYGRRRHMEAKSTAQLETPLILTPMAGFSKVLVQCSPESSGCDKFVLYS